MQDFPLSALEEHEEFRIFRELSTPGKIQDFLNRLPINFEQSRRTCRSPLMSLRHKEAHCMEGAMLAAAIFWHHGERPLILDLKTAKGDDDHVVALFKHGGMWGAVSKTNHAVLRYRDPVYKNLRELALSYFNEYFLDDGRKTLRSYSLPFSLWRYGEEWLTHREHLWDIPSDLDASKHFTILSAGGYPLRAADPIERRVGKVVEWKAPPKSKAKSRRERVRHGVKDSPRGRRSPRSPRVS